MVFFGQVRDRLVTFLMDRHERIVPDILDWELTCTSNCKDPTSHKGLLDGGRTYDGAAAITKLISLAHLMRVLQLSKPYRIQIYI